MVKPTAGSWDVVPYRGAQTNDVEALRAEIADLTATLERLRGMSIYPFGNDCVVCGEPREPRRRWVPARRGFFGLFARPRALSTVVQRLQSDVARSPAREA
jgi:hypothetical protein